MKKALTKDQKLRRKEYAKKWRSENPEKAREHAKRSRLKNRDKILIRQREWMKKNKKRHAVKAKLWYKENKELVRDRMLRKSFGITIAEYELLNEKQKGKCALCENVQHSKRLAVDHCHKTKKIRGLLCANCNVSLGLLQDSVQLLEKAITYLKNHS